MKWEKLSFRLFKLIIWIVIISGIYFYLSYASFKTKIITQKEIVIEIPKWTTFYTLPKALNNNNINIDDFYFKIYLRLGNITTQLQAWTFKIPAWANIKDLLFSLEKPYINTANITILEWWNIFDIDKSLSDKELINKWDFIEIAQDYTPEWYSFLTSWKSLEWFLYPDTYEIKTDRFSSKELIDKMVENFDKKVWNSLKNLSKKEIYNLITMASIVEKEEKSKENRPIVAGILYSRIEVWEPIWADITVCYPYEMTNKECTPSFINKHIRDKNDYNTRTMKWLPISPIWNPSLNAIMASLNPEDTNYYFYLHDKDWKIHFAKTNAEHEANKRKYIY
jgi:UPF0755 protein